jgi:hypothetical protein
MNNKIVIAFLFFTFISCSVKTQLLENNRTKVPKNKDVFSNKKKFNTNLLSVIDVKSVYKEIANQNQYNGIYKFYSNGNLNWFFVEKNLIPSGSFFDPKINGYRGVYYYEKEKIKVDLFAEINGMGKFGIITKTLRFAGDTMRVINDKSGHTQTYLKVPLPKEYQEYKTDW